MLVKVTRRIGVPGVQLSGYRQMGEPVGLNRLIEGLGLVGGHHVAVGGNLEQLLFALFIGALGSHLPGQLAVAFSENHNSVAGDIHGVQLVPAVEGFGIGFVVQLGQGLLDIVLIIQVALLIELNGTHGMSRAALFHELGEDTCRVGLPPLLCHTAEDFLAHGAALPVGDNLFLLDFQVLLGDREVDHIPAVHIVHILQGVAAQLWECGGGLGVVPLLSHDKFAVSYVELLVGKDVLERQRAQFRDGHLALIHLISLRLQNGPLDVDVGLGLHAQLPEFFDTVVHAALLPSCHWFNLLYEYLESRFA